MFAFLFFFFASSVDDEESSRDRHSHERVRHFECFNVIRIIDHAIRDGKSTSAITDELSSHCTKLADPRKNICQSIVPLHISNITTQLSDKKHPDEICESLGFIRHFSGRVISTSQCVRFVNLTRFEVAAQTESSDEKKKSLLPLPRPFSKLGSVLSKRSFRRFFGFSSVCKDVTADERIGCHVISRLVGRELPENIDRNVTNLEICQKLNDRHLIKLSEESGQGEVKGSG
jgi:hypothetical protein